MMIINFPIVFTSILLLLNSCSGITDKKVKAEWSLLVLRHQLIGEASNLTEKVDYQILPEIICGIKVRNGFNDSIQIGKGSSLNSGEYFLMFNNQEELDSIKLYPRRRGQTIKVPPHTTVEFFIATQPNDLKNINIDGYNGLSLQGLRRITANTKFVKFTPSVPDSKRVPIEMDEIYRSKDFVQKIE